MNTGQYYQEGERVWAILKNGGRLPCTILAAIYRDGKWQYKVHLGKDMWGMEGAFRKRYELEPGFKHQTVTEFLQEIAA